MAATGRMSKAMATNTVTLAKVAMDIPTAEEEVQVLREHLQLMGCEGLLDVPWAYRSETMVSEFLAPPPNQYDRTLRAHPEKWSPKMWRDAYRFSQGDMQVAERNDDLLKPEFVRTANPKDGYAIGDLKHPEAKWGF